jgi:hypothetical protein
MVQMDEFGVGGQVQKFNGLRQQQHRWRGKQHRVGQRHDGADRAGVRRLLIGILIGRSLLAYLLDRRCCLRGDAVKNPNDRTNWIASANSASREPCLMFDRNQFIRPNLASPARMSMLLHAQER